MNKAKIWNCSLNISQDIFFHHIKIFLPLSIYILNVKKKKKKIIYFKWEPTCVCEKLFFQSEEYMQKAY